MNAWLVRHGTTEAPPGVAIGWSDVPLDGRGRRQAERLARKLARASLRHVYASDLARARQTAEAIAAKHGLPVEETPALRELDFGRWEGRDLRDLWVETPDDARAWEGDLRRLPPGFGETFESLESRVARFAAALPRDGDLVVVGHRGSLALLYSRLTGTRPEEAWKLPFSLGGLVRVEMA